MTRPLIGVTADIEWREGNPSRDFYFLDARNVPALAEAGAVTVMLPHQTDAIPDYLDRLDGVLVSGGGYQFPDARLYDPAANPGQPPEKVARLAFELALVRAAEARGLPLMGVCGGFQLMNVAGGGTIATSLPALDSAFVTHREGKRFDEAAHEVVIAPGTRLAAATGVGAMLVNSRHSQGVLEPAPGLVASARAPDGVVEAIERPDGPFWLAVQWHPEFHISPGDAALLRAFVAAAGAR